MTDIDWSKAPEYATHWCQKISMFHRDAALCEECIPRPTQKPEVEWGGEGYKILCDYMLCGNHPTLLRKGDPVKIHATVDVGFGEVFLISDMDVRGTGTIVKSQVSAIRTKEQRQKDELVDFVAAASGIRARDGRGAIALDIADAILSRYNLEPKDA